MKLKLIAVATLVAMSSPAYASDCDLDEVIGWTLIAEKTVDGYFQDGNKKEGYEGCEHGRVLIFTDGTGVRCNEYTYHYAYRPDAYIFANGASLKACIDDDWVEVAPLR